MQSIPVVYSADDNFAMPLAVSIFSLIRNMSPEPCVKIYVVDGGITDRSKRKIERISQRANNERHSKAVGSDAHSEVDIVWVKPEMQRWFGQTLTGRGNLNEMTFYRLAMPSFLPPESDKALYVDSDIFFRADASVLMDKVSSAAAIAAVPDYIFPQWQTRYKGDQKVLEKLGVSADDPYFNAGILGVNVAYWRDSDLVEKTIRFLKDFPEHAALCDQDGLNYAIGGKWTPLDLGWNFHPTCEAKLAYRGVTVEQRLGKNFAQLQKQAKAVHFTGAKPWDQGFTNPERGFFERELRLSNWFSVLGYFEWRLRWWSGVLGRRLATKLKSSALVRGSD